MTINNFKNSNYQKDNIISNNPPAQKDGTYVELKLKPVELKDNYLFPKNSDKVTSKSISFVENSPITENNALDNIVKDLSKYFDKSGKILASKRKELADDVFKLLKDENVRGSLIEKLGLNTPDNIDKLLVTMCVEADDGFRKEPIKDPIKVRENIFPLGATVINRFLSTAIIDSVSQYSKTGSIDNFKPKSFEGILTEPHQIAYGATSTTKRNSMISFMKNNSTYDLHRQVAKDLMSGKSNFELDLKGKKKIVNSGDFFHYASPADKIAVINEKIPWTKTPNGHRFSTYPPKTAYGQSIYFTGKNGGKNINWNK